jgi:speckle-type POZ protein
MFENEALADFQLKCNDGEVLKLHKFILAARSPVFFGMLTSDMKEAKEGIADVPDFDSTIMKEVLRFIYCNEVEKLDEVAGELIVAADKYQLFQLTSICLENLAHKVTAENVCKMLMLSSRVNGVPILFDACVEVIRR